MKVIKAYLSGPVKIQKNGPVYNIDTPGLGISFEGRYVITRLCQEIVLKGEHLGVELHIHRGDTHVMTVKDIYKRSKYTLVESDKGFVWQKEKGYDFAA